MVWVTRLFSGVECHEFINAQDSDGRFCGEFDHFHFAHGGLEDTGLQVVANFPVH
jgi:hypothetical protein